MQANEIQHGGEHYKKQAIQVWDYITQNEIPYLEGNAIKYLSRWRDKGGIEDLKKAAHYVQKLIEIEEQRLQGVPEQETCTHDFDLFPSVNGLSEICTKCGQTREVQEIPGNARKSNGQLMCGCWGIKCQGHPDTLIGESS